MHPTLVIATSNLGKLAEFRDFFSYLALDIKGFTEVLSSPVNMLEEGSTFAENAIQKAQTVAQASQHITLADDSGLQVDALDGRPGLRSARFAHEHATDAENNAALIEALCHVTGSSPSLFRARFFCALALVDPRHPSRQPHVVEGTCEGFVTTSPRGSHGFGYDPLFVVPELDRTFAQLSPDEKKSVSHRARAMRALQPTLEQIFNL